MMQNNNFAAFILSHGRPHKVFTLMTLKKHGYTGPVFIIIDDEDSTAPEYFDRYGSLTVIQFNKAEAAKTFDIADNLTTDRRGVVYARNACFAIAKEKGFKYFIQLDDDYTSFQYKFNSKGVYQEKPLFGLDNIFDALLKYYKSIPALSIALAQSGDFMGGGQSTMGEKITMKRKAMNTFICSTDRPFQFLGRINEDVNSYTFFGTQGHLFLTIPNVMIHQKVTQSNSGGMTELYLESGTYLKSFYSVLFCPSSIKVSMIGYTHRRLHHFIQWKHTTPMILHEKYRKP